MDNKDFLEIITRLDKLSQLVDQSLKDNQLVEEPYQSDTVAELFSSLAQAQSKLPPIETNKVNPWFESPYADIFHISRTIYPTLGSCGLSVMQQNRVTSDGGTVLYTRVCHSSGEWMESRVRVIPPKNDIDSFRSMLNALRVTQVLSILGIGISSDPFDDDGEVAMITPRGNLAKSPSVKNLEAKKQEGQTITKEQRDEIEYEMGDYTDLAQEIMDRCHVRSLADIPKSQFRNAVSFIRKNKRAREGKSS